jgi:hypothetical protein
MIMKSDANHSVNDSLESSCELKRVVEHIVSTTPLSILFELYYWAQEPSLLDLLRRLVLLSVEDRKAIESFFRQAAEKTVVTATRESRSRLVLEAKNVNGLVSELSHRHEDAVFGSQHKKLN